MILNTTIKRLFSKLINIHKFKPSEPVESNAQLSVSSKTSEYHQFNFTIKRLTTISQVFDTHRKHHKKLYPQQLSYIFYKIVQLWQINQSQIKNVDKLNQLCNEILTKIDKFPPETMIKILHTCTSLNQECILVCLPLMNYIIDTLNDGNNIELVSQQQRTKLLFCLEKLVNRIGNRLTPNSIKLFRKIVGSISNSLSTLKISFQMQLINRFHVRKFCSYNVAEKICKQLLKHQKTITTENLFIMHSKIIQHEELRKKLQTSILQHRNIDANVLNRVHRYILKKIHKNRQELKLLPSQLVIRYLEYLIQIPDKMKQIFEPEINVMVVGFWLLKFGNSIYSKYFLQNYKNNIQKKQTEAWIRENPNFIVQCIQFISKLTNMHQNLQNEVREFLNTLCQFYVQLKLKDQIQLLKYLIQQKYSNSDSVANTFISQLNKKDIKFTVQDAYAFTKILQYQQCTKKLNPEWLNAIIKSIFDHSESIDNIGQYSALLSAYTGLHINNLQIIIKQYIKISLKNRCYANRSIQLLQAYSNKLSQRSKRIISYRDDNGYLDQQYQIRQTILKKIQKSLNNLEFIILILSKIASNNGHTLNIGQDQLCKELYQNWLQQFISFKFENLLTYEQIEKIYKLQEAFKINTNLQCVQLFRKRIQKSQTAK